MMRWRPWSILMATLLVTVVLSACGGSTTKDSALETSESSNDMAQPEMMSEEVDDAAGQTEMAKMGSAETDAADSAGSNNNKGVADGAEFGDRKVIYRAQIDMEVKNYDTARTKIEKMVSKTGGYIIETSQYEEDNVIGGFLIARIPQDKFTGFLDQVEEMADKVSQRQVTGSDVTEEYVDLESRLKAKKAVEKRLLTFMEDAKKTEDLLKISADLGRVQEEIEQLTGRMTYLQNQVAFSTVNIDLTQSVVNRGISGENERHTLAAAWQALVASTNGVLAFFSGTFVFLAGSLPVLLILVVIAIPLGIWWRKKGRQAILSKVKKRDSDE